MPSLRPRHSPRFKKELKKVKTPTLLMTGEDDFRTPISEAEQFYDTLKLLKIDTVLVRCARRAARSEHAPQPLHGQDAIHGRLVR